MYTYTHRYHSLSPWPSLQSIEFTTSGFIHHNGLPRQDREWIWWGLCPRSVGSRCQPQRSFQAPLVQVSSGSITTALI